MSKTQAEDSVLVTSVRISKVLHKRLRIKAAEDETSVTAIVEEAVTRHLRDSSNGNRKRIRTSSTVRLGR